MWAGGWREGEGSIVVSGAGGEGSVVRWRGGGWREGEGGRVVL